MDSFADVEEELSFVVDDEVEGGDSGITGFPAPELGVLAGEVEGVGE